MSGFSSRWRALAAAARDAAEPAAGADRERMRAIAAAGLARRGSDAGRGSAFGAARPAGLSEWGSLALAAGLLIATGLGLWWADLPLGESAGTLARDLAELPRHVPRAPRLPSPAMVLAELDGLAALRWDDPAPPAGSAHPTAPENRP